MHKAVELARVPIAALTLEVGYTYKMGAGVGEEEGVLEGVR